MQLSELDYNYPASAVAQEPKDSFRTLLVAGETHSEITREEIFKLLKPGDVLVINTSKVLKRRLFLDDGDDVLFLNEESPLHWRVLFHAKPYREGETLNFSSGLEAQLVEKGIPQLLKVNAPVTEDFFAKHGELAVPPYILKVREDRHNRQEEERWYQTAWAKNPGSLAAPTASLHFSNQDLENLRARGVHISEITLHVGIGTFLPIRTEQLEDHEMHAEWIEIKNDDYELWQKQKREGRRVWALGTTAVRSIESCARGLLERRGDLISGPSRLFIYPGYEFQLVDGLLTNFHQPKSTLLALVAAFAGLENVKRAYEQAIKNNFRLFSYGDLSIWLK